MTSQEILKKHKTLRLYMAARGLEQHAEDFAQEAIIAIVGGRKASTFNLFKDFARKHFGSMRGGRKRKFNELTDRVAYTDQLLTSIREPSGDFTRLVNQLEPDLRIIFILHFVFQLTMLEIGYTLNLSEARISQKIKEGLRELKARMNRHLV